MSANFDWQTEEDDRRRQTDWDETPEPPRGGGKRRPRWRLIGLIAALAVAAGALVWWRAAERIEATTQAVRTDVIASHNLVQRAASDGDEEIFRSFLSGRDPAWTAGELEVFRQELFVDRAPFGLMPAEGSLPAILSAPEAETAAGQRPADIELSPSFDEAVVAIDQPFRTADGATILLQQTTVYRRGDQRWLLAPPLEEFWGEWQSSQGEYLRLIYPGRDEAIGAQLAGDLDAEIARLCDTLEDIDCSADLFLTVRLDTDPAALAALTRPLGALERARQSKDIIELPAPTLVGLPAGDSAEQRAAGYEALRQGYTRHLLSAVIAQVVGWECCDEKLLFQLLLEYQLSELGLAEWTVTEADYQLILDEQLRLRDLGSYLHTNFPFDLPQEKVQQARTAVDFLVHSVPDVSVAEMMRQSNRRARTFGRFVSAIWPNAEEGQPPPAEPNVAWWLYAYQGSLTPDEPAVPAAEEDLYLACTTMGDSQRPEPSLFFRYLPEEETWTELYRLDGFIWMSPLPGADSLLLQEFALASEAWQTSVWRDGQRLVAYAPDDNTYAVSLGQTDPTGRQLIAYSFDPDDGFANGFLINLDECEDGGCSTTPLPAIPYWSPNGEWAIYTGSGDTYPQNVLVSFDRRYSFLDSSVPFLPESLALGPGDAEPPDLTEVGQGYAPFWLDESTYGYIRYPSNATSLAPSAGTVIRTQGDATPRGSGVGLAGRGAGTEVVIATLDDPTPRTLITAADLEQFLPDDNQMRRLTLAYVATHPAHPDTLFIVALDDLEQRAHVFAYDRTAGRPEWRLSLLYDLNHSLSFSPDGRYLAMTGHDQATTSGDNSGVMLLHDIAANRTVPFVTRLPFFLPSAVLDWTEDGRWLAVALADNLVGLVAPEEEQVQLLSHPYGACTSVAWLEP
ncbi:hypothetical protein [Promineifilum sp.]|uniref:hypothetical protein n=1 Tax=Promineifilum sp. TaxID=2664178 RepID=UPI0035B268A9